MTGVDRTPFERIQDENFWSPKSDHMKRAHGAGMMYTGGDADGRKGLHMVRLHNPPKRT